MELMKLILVIPATNVLSKRSFSALRFSALRRLKTWLRNTMGQARLNWVMILNVHNDETDQLDLESIANDFISRNLSRLRIFRIFV